MQGVYTYIGKYFQGEDMLRCACLCIRTRAEHVSALVAAQIHPPLTDSFFHCPGDICLSDSAEVDR